MKRLQEKLKQGGEFLKAHWQAAIAALVIILFLVGSAVVIARNDLRLSFKKNQKFSRSEIVQEFAPAQSSEPKPVDNVRGPEPTPAAPAVAGTKHFRSEALGISATVPADTAVKETANQVELKSAGGSKLIIVNSYRDTNETLDSLEHQLRNSPQVSNLSRTTFQNIPALGYDSPGSEKSYAFLRDNRLYYFTGSLGSTFLQDLTFF